MNIRSQEFISKNLICPYSGNELFLREETKDASGEIVAGEFRGVDGEVYFLKDGSINFLQRDEEVEGKVYSLDNMSYVEKLINNGWSFGEIARMDLLRSNIDSLINSFVEEYANGFLLEVGAGGNYLKERFAGRVENWITSDYDVRANVDIRCDAQSLPFKSNIFDTIVCIDVIEHVRDPHKMMSELVRALKPGGFLILSTPFFFYMHESPYDFSRFSKFGLLNLMEKYDMGVVTVRPTGGVISTLGILVTATIVHVFSRFKHICNIFLCVNKIIQRLLHPVDRYLNKSQKFSQGNFIVSKKKEL
jgi:SAM-dependent methyltransferase